MPDEQHPKKNRFILIGIIIAFLYVLAGVILASSWYKNQWTGSFHFFNDLLEWKQMDKLGHFYCSFQLSYLTMKILIFGGVTERKACLTSTLLTFVIVSSIEIPDGFSENYGASVYDIAANTLGCSAFIFQFIFLRKLVFFPKLSAHLTSYAMLRPSLLGDGFFQQLIKDYNGQTYWMSFHINRLKLPAWLNFAVGMGAEGMVWGTDGQNEQHGFSPYRKYFISIDVNFASIKTKSTFVKSVFSIVNLVRLPFPALEVSSEGVKFHFFYF